MISKETIVEYFAMQPNGVHRINTEEFLRGESEEKIFHIGVARSILDFGCGTGDLLVYYAMHYPLVLGVDLTEASVVRARERLVRFNAPHANVICADEASMWPELKGQEFDVLTSAGVMQYLDDNQFRSLIRNARTHLSPTGRVAMFDIIDPRLYWLFKYGWFRDKPFSATYVAAALRQSTKVLVRKFVRWVGRSPEDHIGKPHHPSVVQRIAEEEGYTISFVSSMYYQYRYHALLIKNG